MTIDLGKTESISNKNLHDDCDREGTPTIYNKKVQTHFHQVKPIQLQTVIIPVTHFRFCQTQQLQSII